jgi:hypothetical protein
MESVVLDLGLPDIAGRDLIDRTDPAVRRHQQRRPAGGETLEVTNLRKGRIETQATRS